MAKDYAAEALAWATGPDCRPLKIKALARHLSIDQLEYPEFRDAVKRLVREGQLELGPDRTLGPATQPAANTLQGTFKRSLRGFGFVRPEGTFGRESDLFIPPDATLDASTGDLVEVRIVKRSKSRAGSKSGNNREGRILRIISRASSAFVGTYLEHRGRGYVKIDGLKFEDPILVGDPGAKGVQPGDKVALEMTRYPSPDRAGQGVIAEVLGPRGAPGVDTLAIMREYDLPEAFDESVLADAREQVRAFREDNLSRHQNLLDVLTVTIDPVDARDFDDAISLSRDDRGFWTLMVHVADVSWFVKHGSPMDLAARKRGNSVYLPDRVIPMLPEALSNSLASLQEGEVRFAATATLDFSPEGVLTNKRFARTAIRVNQRFTYEQAMAVISQPETPHENVAPEVQSLLVRMRELAMILRRRRFQRGALELSMPDVEIELDENGAVKNAHLATHDESHQVIEEFMLAANEAVATFLTEREIDFPRRGHAHPDPAKLDKFAQFVRSLGVPLEDPQSRAELQRVLNETADQPIRHAVHFGLLRSLKQAAYTAEHAPHYALASENYCHFTSPIRRYPDLIAHRQLLAILEGKRPRETVEAIDNAAKHCNRTERRAEAAERELIRIKLLTFLQSKVGEDFHAIIIGVEDFGFFCQLREWPIEGLVRLERLGEGVYDFDDVEHSLVARSGGRRFRLGDQIVVRIQNVDVDRRVLDLRWISSSPTNRSSQSIKSAKDVKNHGQPVEKRQKATGRKIATDSGERRAAATTTTDAEFPSGLKSKSKSKAKTKAKAKPRRKIAKKKKKRG